MSEAGGVKRKERSAVSSERQGRDAEGGETPECAGSVRKLPSIGLTDLD